MSIKISELPLAGTVSGTELVPIVQDGTTSQISLSQLGPVVPSTAKILLPDVGTIVSELLDIVDNYGLTGNATYSDDSLWSTFTASNVANISGLVDVNDFYIGGFYNEGEYTDEGGDMINVAYTGNFDFDALNQSGNPDYGAGSFYVIASIDTDTYEVLDFVNLSLKSEVGINYNWENSDKYYVSGIFSNIAGPNVVLTFDIQVDVANDTVDWTIEILGD